MDSRIVSTSIPVVFCPPRSNLRPSVDHGLLRSGMEEWVAEIHPGKVSLNSSSNPLCRSGRRTIQATEDGLLELRHVHDGRLLPMHRQPPSVLVEWTSWTSWKIRVFRVWMGGSLDVWWDNMRYEDMTWVDGSYMTSESTFECCFSLQSASKHWSLCHGCTDPCRCLSTVSRRSSWRKNLWNSMGFKSQRHLQPVESSATMKVYMNNWTTVHQLNHAIHITSHVRSDQNLKNSEGWDVLGLRLCGLRQ